MKVFIIREDYESNECNDTMTNVLPYWYETLQEALDALHALASDLMVSIEPDAWSFDAPPESGIYCDTYYVMELDRG